MASSATAAVLRVVACGSVDDGKSTLIGRLLAETGSVPDDALDDARRTRRGGSTIPPGEVDFSLLTDGLEAEHEQGITIDVAYRHLYLPSGRRAIIADAPGHEQYTRNMAVAASTADVAVLVIDAARGIRAQTQRHLTVCRLLGTATVIAVVNKLDCFGYQQPVFDDLTAELTAAAQRVGVRELVSIPASALAGDNVTARSARTPWYAGPTLLDALDAAEPRPGREPAAGGLRLPVQYVVRDEGFRGYAGTITAGGLRPGDSVAVAGSGRVTTVTRILRAGTEVAAAAAGEPVVVALADDTDVTRGDLLAAPADVTGPLAPAGAFTAELIWTGEQPLLHGRSYLLAAGPRTVPAVITAVRGVRDVQTGELLAARTLAMNDIGTVELTTDSPLPLDSYTDAPDTGAFLLVDRLSRDTVAAGLVRHPLRRGQNVTPHSFTVDRAARAAIKNQRPRVLWLTGLPGAGKSTVADALERRLHALGLHTYVLDGDNVRSTLNKDLGFTPEDRAENVRRVGEVARLMFDAGLIVIVALVSPFRADRRAVRDLFADGDFVEVHLDTPPEICAQRDPKGLYAKARTGVIPNMTGVGQGYEPPEAAEVTVAGAGDLDAEVERLVGIVCGPTG